VFVLDTDTFTHFVDGDDAFISARANANLERLWISVVTIEEVMRGALNSLNDARDPNPQRRRRTRTAITVVEAYQFLFQSLNIFHRFQVMPYTADAERVFQGFPSGLRTRHPNDCRIAASAVEHGFTVVTCNTRDYVNLPGVLIEDWSVNPNFDSTDQSTSDG
jgi:tRNA(fMet)-specific endonuclease VapC